MVTAESPGNLQPEDLAEAELFAGWIAPELVRQMPRLRFVQLCSAGADSYGWIPEKIVLANAYGAYGDSIAEHICGAFLYAIVRRLVFLLEAIF